MLDVVIIDDEPLAVRRLQMLVRNVSDVRVLGAASSAESGLKLLSSIPADVVLLDIGMPGLDGVTLAKQLNEKGSGPYIIFVTAYSEFAVEAFELAASDYLLKPVARERLSAALDKVRKAKVARELICKTTEPDFVADHISAKAPPAIWIDDHNGRRRVAVKDVLWVAAEGDYVRLYVGDRSYLIRGRIGDFARRLGSAGFVRVHRSALVQSRYVARIKVAGDRRFHITLANGSEISTSRQYASAVRNLATN